MPKHKQQQHVSSAMAYQRRRLVDALKKLTHHQNVLQIDFSDLNTAIGRAEYWTRQLEITALSLTESVELEPTELW